MNNHWETHLYTYAVALTQGAAILPENLQGMRQKAINHGHTEGECQRVESEPMEYVRHGFSRSAVVGKNTTARGGGTTRKGYHLKNGVRLISCRSAYGATAAVWLTWAGAPMIMPRDQIAAWLRTARRHQFVEATL